VSHWTDRLEQESDHDEPLVRPYTITGGRTAPGSDGLTLVTLVTAVPADAAADRPQPLQPEHRAILARCVTPVALVEIAAAVDLPISVTKILVADLAASGTVTLRAPSTGVVDGDIDTNVLLEVRNGLARL
jgi:hypothetical protein